ncbi:hypothetical protein BES34_018140 [Leptospira inadai serovar Lyme]|uniref:Uncharacterized protein n=1 Tax=Leptospira inadai serovar Lyme TaxID=293084 RepID=A0ABX4YE80_9LEPT|nr:hypothetical protein BES34_018140 [Leptospira inadai serovar Lyme]
MEESVNFSLRFGVYRGLKTEDRCARLARARQKLPDLGKVKEVEGRSAVTQESFCRTWKFRSPMFCPQSSVFRPLKDISGSKLGKQLG